ncbi:MAG: CotH kinase family protein [Candidatus Saccharibacteria bacterium]|nr:CotH kinase family protein [Candidatus Saccharibacteria bacterium]
MKRSRKNAARLRNQNLAALIVSLLASILIIAIVISKITDFFILSTSSMPKLKISLTDVPIELINTSPKDIKYPNNIVSLTTNQNKTIYNDVEIKGRGNTTWNLPKKPYQIKLSQKASLLNLPSAKKWILLANYLDNSFLRTDTAFYLEKLLDEKYRLSGNFVELYIDDDYEGLYYLTEKIEVKESRVNLKNPLGVIMELDNFYADNSKDCFEIVEKANLCFHDSVNQDNADIAELHFRDSFNTLVSAIKAKNYPIVSSVIDVDSFAKYYLLNEFSSNPDAYTSSFFMYKDGDDDKIHAGPGWDFDIAFGHPNWTPSAVDPSSFHSPFETNPLKTYIIDNQSIEDTTISPLIYDLLNIPEFEDRVKAIYQETISGHGDELLDYIETRANYIRPAALKDYERWKLKANFDDEVDYLIDWVAKRYSHFEEIYGVDANT